MRHQILAATVAAVLLPLTATTAATAKPAAKPKPWCELVPDGKTDAVLVNSATGKTVPELDIQSIDVASGPKTVVVVLRLGSTAFTSQPLLTHGAYWLVEYFIWGAKVDITYTMSPGGSLATFKTTATVWRARQSAPVTVTTATPRDNTVVWTMDRTQLPELRKKNGLFMSFFAETNADAVGHDYAPDDGYASKVKYPDLAPSCVKAA